MDSLKDVGDLVTQVNIAEVRSFLFCELQACIAYR